MVYAIVQCVIFHSSTAEFHQYDTIIYPLKERQSSSRVEKLTKVFTSAIGKKVSTDTRHQFTPKSAEAMRVECLSIYLRIHQENISGFESSTDGGIDQSISDISNTFQALGTQWICYQPYGGGDYMGWPFDLLEVSPMLIITSQVHEHG